jgi:GTP-binding protein HflX
VDLLPSAEVEALLRHRGGVAISAERRQGLETLLAKADRTLFAEGSSQRLGALSPAAALMQG